MKLAPVLHLPSKPPPASKPVSCWRRVVRGMLGALQREQAPQAPDPATVARRSAPTRPAAPPRQQPPLQQGPSGVVPRRAGAPPPPPRRAVAAVDSIAPAITAPRDLDTSTAPVRAIAVAHENSNAVGTVELSCTADGLMVHYVSISGYADGYVPYPMTISQRVTVPYPQVARVVVDDDDLVHIVLDPAATPYNKLALAGLVRELPWDHAISHRKRERVERQITLGALVGWMPVAGLLMVLAPSFSASLLVIISLSLAGCVHVLRRDVASRLVLFSRRSEKVRDQLVAELSWRLGPHRVRLAVAHKPQAQEAVAQEPQGLQSAEAGSLRGLLATAGVVAAVAALAIVVGRTLLTVGPAPDAQADLWPWTTTLSGPEAQSDQRPSLPASAPIQPDPEPKQVVLPPCTCERADSPLWADGIPRMSVISRNRPGRTSAERPSMYPEIAVVNNANSDLKDIVMVVDFLLAPPEKGAKARVVDKQDLFWEGRLGPGKAGKWRVKGRGNDFAVNSFITGKLGEPDLEPAPADAFFELSMTARTPSVRVHGTKMLAYLGDQRASQALEKLRSGGFDEWASTITQIGNATRPLRVCSVRVHPDAANERSLRVEGCVFNASNEDKPNALVTVHMLRDGEPHEARWNLGTNVPAGAGRLTQGLVTADDNGDGETSVVEVLAEP